MKRKISCSHPYLYPTQWNQPKPMIWEGYTCECGRNWCCPICGYGEAVFPCDCTKNTLKKYPIHPYWWINNE